MIRDYDPDVVDEPIENDTLSASGTIYYSTPSTSNRFPITKITSQIPKLYLENDEDATQSWYWSDLWQSMEREADKNLAEDDYEEFDSMDDFIASL